MAFDPYKLAPTLGAVAGAYASPYNPVLGASIGSGLGGALFTTEEEKNAKVLRDLQIKGAEQNLKQGDLSMAATQQAMEINKANAAYSANAEADRAKKAPFLQTEAENAAQAGTLSLNKFK
jgi:hypothetical protein